MQLNTQQNELLDTMRNLSGDVIGYATDREEIVRRADEFAAKITELGLSRAEVAEVMAVRRNGGSDEQTGY